MCSGEVVQGICPVQDPGDRKVISGRSRIARFASPRLAPALALIALGGNPAPAFAYIGPSYLMIAGINGDARPAQFRGWVRAEANYWTQRPELQEIRGIRDNKNDLLFTGSQAPAGGSNVLSLAIDKANPALEPLLTLCRKGATIPEVTFAESSDLARHPQAIGRSLSGEDY